MKYDVIVIGGRPFVAVLARLPRFRRRPSLNFPGTPALFRSHGLPPARFAGPWPARRRGLHAAICIMSDGG